jgi:AcrR family transcriptional regulator
VEAETQQYAETSGGTGRPQSETGVKPLGRRGERFRLAVLATTVELITAEGIEAVTVATVAAAAGVHESSIYRNFGTWENLVRKAVEQHTDNALAVPDTGSLDEDLRGYAASLVSFLADPAGEVLLRLGARPQSTVNEDPAWRERFWQDRLDRACAMVARGIERGEVRPDCDPRLLVEALNGVLFAKVLFFQEPLHAGLVDELVEQLLRGVRRPE